MTTASPRPDSMRANPEVQALLDLPAVRDRSLGFTEPWDETRSRKIVSDLRGGALSGPAPLPVSDVSDIVVVDTPARVYRPSTSPALPIIVFFHGGGWVFGDLDTQDYACRGLANASNSVVISIDYGLAPEHAFPEPVDQAIAVTRAVVEDARQLGGDPSRVLVAGASSGGNLAAAVAIDAATDGWGPLAGLMLVYPPLDATTSGQSYIDNADGYNLSALEMRFYWQMYHQGKADLHDAQLSPLFAPDLSGLPPTLVFTAELDVLRDDGEAFAERLADAGIPVHLRRYDGQIHGFLGLGHLSSDTGHALTEMGAWVRRTVPRPR